MDLTVAAGLVATGAIAGVAARSLLTGRRPARPGGRGGHPHDGLLAAEPTAGGRAEAEHRLATLARKSRDSLRVGAVVLETGLGPAPPQRTSRSSSPAPVG